MKIYCLTINNKKYIGKTTQNIASRTNQHLSKLSRNIHNNYKLQEYYNLYGDPTVSIIEDGILTEELLNSREIYWINELDTINNGLNILSGGEGVGHGASHPSSKLTEDDYLAIVSFLANTDMTQKEVANELDVPLSIVNNICSGYTHQYLLDIDGENYKKMIYKNRSNRSHTDILYMNVLIDIADSSLTYKEIAEKYNINVSIVGHIASGKRHIYLKDKYPEEYHRMLSRNRKGIKTSSSLNKQVPKVKSPTGEIYEVVNVRQFSLLHNLTDSAMYLLIKGTAKSHKGWRLV